jgi:hypothetical protein
LNGCSFFGGLNKKWVFIILNGCVYFRGVTLELFAKELVELWDPGIMFNGTVYRVGVVSAIFDGKGFEQVTKTQGSVSLQGCNACNFPGVWFGHGKSGSVVYPYYSRYLDINDPRRLKRPLRVPHCNAMYNLKKFIPQSILSFLSTAL